MNKGDFIKMISGFNDDTEMYFFLPENEERLAISDINDNKVYGNDNDGIIIDMEILFK